MHRDPLTLEPTADSPPRQSVASVKPRVLELIPRSVEGWSWPCWIRPGEKIPLAAAPETGAAAVGQVVAEFVDRGARTRAVSVEGSRVTLHFDPRAAVEQMVQERYVRLRRPLHTYGQISRLVNLLPGSLRLLGHRAASGVERHRQDAPAVAFPDFPRDRAVELVRLLARRAQGLDDRPAVWPGEQRSVVLLTHDVDTAEGQALIPEVARVERELGFTSCWYVVGDRYALDHGLLRELRQGGHEIGLHGARHDCKLAYLPRREMARRLDRCRGMMERHQVAGFRSPALLMTAALTRELCGRFVYDSSVPDTDVDTICAPHRGCSTVFPYYKDDLLELPLTLPLDDRLLLLGMSAEQMIKTWLAKMDWIQQLGGMTVVTTHVEPHLGASPALLAGYRRLLEQIKQRRETVRPMLPVEVARVWNAGSGSDTVK